ncbi:Ig-like domain-containing protein [Rufibacter sp. LB8]|uniref:Ig-like domain-containing protein n=1 Tax=Rufibacter sp. LB8 TaxID=2777781 RepID=UPI00178C1FD0|nr:Ig-like domain-containing protein [Rufibacter sp. LB8]
MKNKLKNGFYLLSIVFMTACASVGNPEGGERDSIAPKLVSSVPLNGEVNSRPKSIVLTFDEPIQTLDLNRQLIIAPSTDNTYKTRIKDKTLEITFTNPWLDSTTYSLNFRNGIADVTEKNKAKNVTITFSTGAFLDSGRVEGKVFNVLTNRLPEEVTILLFSTQDTGQIAKGKALYVTSADSSGSFAFKNIKEGNYFIYALAESNNNLRYDNEKEQLAFLPDSIQVRPAVTGVSLALHTQDITPPRVISKKSFLNVYELEYNEGISAIKLSGNLETDIRTLIDANGRTVRLFPAMAEERTWLVEATDSSENKRVDTVAVRLTGKATPRRNNTFTIASGSTVKPTEPLKLVFDLPTKIINPEGAIQLVADTITTINSATAKDFQFNQNQTELTVNLVHNAKRELSVKIDTTKVLPFIGEPYANEPQRVQVSDRPTTGSLRVALSTTRSSFIVQLMQNDKVVRELANQKTFTWDNLQPGTYQIRILVDENNNGKWDNGLLSERRIPEKVILHTEQFPIKIDWEITVNPAIAF